jgi:phage-related holin
MNKQWCIEIDGQQILVTEEVYRAYKRPLWAEHKRKERAMRCRDENGNRCTKSCRECPKLRDCGDLSLEKFSDDGFEVADSVDIAELIADKLLLEQLVVALDNLDSDERSLIGAHGIAKKAAIFLIVGIGHLIDFYLLGNDGAPLRTAVIFFYIANEGISLLENATVIGLPVPEKLKDVLAQLHGKDEEK